MAYLRQGWQPIPIPLGSKAPRTKNWQQIRLSEDGVDLHFNSDSNLGILLGEASGGIVDVDLDARQAVNLADAFLPSTNRIHGRRSKPRSHRWYRSPDIKRPQKFVDVDGTCLVEIRTEGQQTLVPPSIHPSGEALTWACQGEVSAVASKALISAVNLLAAASLIARHWPERGSRHDASLALHGFLLRSNFTQDDAMRFVMEVARAAGDEEWRSRSLDGHKTSERIRAGLAATGRVRLAKLVGKAVVDLASNWLGIQDMGWASETRRLNRTDLGNAQRFVMIHGPDVRFCHTRRKWLTYDGRKWKDDDTGEVLRRAKQTVKDILTEAAAEEDDENRKRLVAWQMQSEFEHRIKSLVGLAESENGIPVRVGDLDADPQLFNCANGTLRLEDGSFREHHCEDLITKSSPVAYSDSADCPLWNQFIRRITANNIELMAYLQRVTGYCLTGSTNEQCLFLLYGAGANGKTTYLEVLRYVWGDYAKTAEFSSFTATRGSGVRNDLARLAGARLVTAVESEYDHYLAEQVVKQITGGDTVTARYLYSEHFEFRPQFKLFLATSHRPKVRGSDQAIWRRIILIPFIVAIPEQDQDKDLQRKLREEAPGILAWAMAGLASWRESGLQPPVAITRATNEYRSEQDELQHFIDEQCVLDPSARTAASALYSAYASWCQAEGQGPMCKRDFGQALREHGFSPSRNAGNRQWTGIRMRNELERNPNDE